MRKTGMVRAGWLVGASVMLMLLNGCGGASPDPKTATPPGAGDPSKSTEAAPTSPATAPTTPAKDAPDSMTTTTTSSVGSGTSATSGTKEARPFANTSQEATNYIDEAVETRHNEVETCVADARVRRKAPHAEISVELGIDQEGTLIGVKAPKGTPQDKVLLDCIRGALQGAPFPRSKAGVITLKKTFSDQVIRR